MLRCIPESDIWQSIKTHEYKQEISQQTISLIMKIIYKAFPTSLILTVQEEISFIMIICAK